MRNENKLPLLNSIYFLYYKFLFQNSTIFQRSKALSFTSHRRQKIGASFWFILKKLKWQ